MNNIKNNLSGINKLFFIYLIIGFLYGIILPFMFHNNPFDMYGTLSLLCENRKPWFWGWVFLDTGSIVVGFYLLYKKYGNAGKLIKILPALAFVSSCIVALTLGHDITTWNPKRVAHWISTGAYIAFLFFSMAVYALKNLRFSKFFKIVLITVFADLLIFLLGFLIYGRSGIVEIIPNLLLQLFLFFTVFVFDRDRALADNDGKNELSAKDL